MTATDSTAEPGFDCDVAVLGAGAAGLVAALRAAERGRRVVLLEKNRRTGVKILISGGTRCNITNARGLRRLDVVSGPIDPAYDPSQALGARSIQQAFGPAGTFLGPALRAFGVEQTVALFEREGVATHVEANGKIFPVSNRATDVLAALRRRLERSGALLHCDCPVRDVMTRGPDADAGFDVCVPGAPLRARRVIVGVGGQSYPGCGTTGDGYALARRFGHTIVSPRPALVPLKVAADWVPALRGLSVPDVHASIRQPAGPVLLERREALLFAHFGLTGPAIRDVSRAVARHDGPEPLDLVLDFAPAAPAEALDRELQSASRSGRRAVATLLPPAIPRRLAEALVTVAGIPADRMGPDLSRSERHRLIAVLKGLRLPVTGTLGFAKAEVTSGGVALDEIDVHTLESRRQRGLHFVGEVLDLDGRIGGYNFQAAWSTGWLAGEVV
jgi:predicted Rossmann fold flavoprotein